jgi:hypothetical protein
VSAQSLQGVIDQALDTTQISAQDETEYLTVRYQDLVPVLTRAIQEQQATIERLQSRIDALENK